MERADKLFTKLRTGEDETGRDIHVASGARPRPVFHTEKKNSAERNRSGFADGI